MRRNDTCHREPHIYFNCRSDGEPYQEQTARTRRPVGGLRRCHQPRDSPLSENARPLKNHGHL